ncbi:MAG: S-layer family protein [Scytonema sp. CRU_2_7]|nr:S-layer family protein [Scytonema sp. CRU_2_7]
MLTRCLCATHRCWGRITLLYPCQRGSGIRTSTGSGIFSIVYTGAEGKSGNIELQANSVSLTDGAYISASTGGKGDAGSVRINVSGPVSVDGSYITSSVESSGVGKAGGIDITARSLFVNNGGRISTSNLGNGTAGNIKVTTAKDIRLDNQATIRANTNGGEGNISLNSLDLILRRNSSITTNATGTADGGSITIDTGNLVALEKSEITAKAQQGYGGEVIITTTGGRFISPDSVISASSEAGPQFSGTVQFNTPDIDPSQGLIEFPETVTDPAQQIAQNPCLRGGGEFIITGRGGFPTDPSKVFSSDNVRVDLVKPVASQVNVTTTTHKQPSTTSTSATDKPIVPARGWIFNEKGEVTLVAYDPTKTGPQREPQTPANSCAAQR